MRTIWLILLVGSGYAFAGDDAQAKTYFNAGAQAFAAGQFQTAIRAFEQAYRLSPKPGVLFSLGQAERRQFIVDRDPGHLERAITAFRRYVEGEEQGTRRLEAIEALTELEPMVQQARPSAAKPTATQAAPRLMVTSPTPGATVVVDGTAGGPAPLIRDVTPGAHRVQVTAEGFEPEVRTVPVTEGDLVAIDVSLREQPALVNVFGPKEATVYIDGQQRGILPLEKPLVTGPGEHRLGLLLPGREGVAEYITMTRGSTLIRSISPRLSFQRGAALTAIGLGIASLASMIGVSLWTGIQANEASTLYNNGNRALTTADVTRYIELRRSRDTGVTIAGTLFLAGLLFEALGLVLYASDNPRLPEPKPRQSP
jgi:tetratricopeptide (TPR) repeat protein